MLASPKRSALLSVLLHGALVAALLLLGSQPRELAATHARTVVFTPIDVAPLRAPLRRASRAEAGGGDRSNRPASLGRLPRAARRQFTPPAVAPRNLNPVLAMEPTIVVGEPAMLPVVNLAQFGDPNGRPGPPSGGTGSGGGIGEGRGTGVGSGSGPGYTAGPGDGAGPGAVRGAVTPPVLLSKTEPEYSDEARRAKLQGTITLLLELDERGEPRSIAVRSGLGLGLDERAIDAVRRWKFRPGRRNGRPVATTALVEVSFRLL